MRRTIAKVTAAVVFANPLYLVGAAVALTVASGIAVGTQTHIVQTIVGLAL